MGRAHFYLNALILLVVGLVVELSVTAWQSFQMALSV